MRTTEKLQANLQKAKTEIKFAESIEIVLQAFQNRESYTFDMLSGRVKELFMFDSILKFGEIRISSKGIKGYEELHMIVFDEKPNNTKELKKVVKFIETHFDKCYEIAYSLVKESEQQTV